MALLKTFCLMTMVCLLLLAFTVFAAEGPVTFKWSVHVDSPTPTGFKIYSSLTGTPDSFSVIPGYDNILYTGGPMILAIMAPVPDNAVTEVFFALTAFNSGGESGFSDITSKTFDTVPPVNPPYAPLLEQLFDELKALLGR